MANDQVLLLSSGPVVDGSLLAACLQRAAARLEDATVVCASNSLGKDALPQSAFATAVSVAHAAEEHTAGLLRAILGALRPGGALVLQEPQVRTITCLCVAHALPALTALGPGAVFNSCSGTTVHLRVRRFGAEKMQAFKGDNSLTRAPEYSTGLAAQGAAGVEALRKELLLAGFVDISGEQAPVHTAPEASACTVRCARWFTARFPGDFAVCTGTLWYRSAPVPQGQPVAGAGADVLSPADQAVL